MPCPVPPHAHTRTMQGLHLVQCKQYATTRTTCSAASREQKRHRHQKPLAHLQNSCIPSRPAPAPHLVTQKHQVVVGGGGVLLRLVLQGLCQRRHVQPEVFRLWVTLGGVTAEMGTEHPHSSKNALLLQSELPWVGEGKPPASHHRAKGRRHCRHFKTPSPWQLLPPPMQGT